MTDSETNLSGNFCLGSHTKGANFKRRESPITIIHTILLYRFQDFSKCLSLTKRMERIGRSPHINITRVNSFPNGPEAPLGRAS